MGSTADYNDMARAGEAPQHVIELATEAGGVVGRAGGDADLVARFKRAGLYLDQFPNGVHAVSCPWAAQHADGSVPSQISATRLVPGTQGGHAFVCVARSCALKTVADVLDALAEGVKPDPRIVWPYPKLGKHGEFIGPSRVHVENTKALLEAYGISARYNQMTHRPELVVPGFTPPPERAENAMISKVIDLAERHGLAEKQTIRHLQELQVDYHPVRDWISTRAWDGVDRLAPLLATLHLAPSCDADLAHLLARRWLVNCVCAVMPGFAGFRPQGVLTFQGAQGAGKTSWLRSLAPPNSGWFAEGLDVDPHDRDSVQRLTSVWIAELGEVDATFKKADVAALKALVTREEDIYRSAYDRREERIPRRTMLTASVNRVDFLVDDTGNRRWWAVPIDAADWQHGIDMQQLWAQVYVRAQAGEPWWLSAEEQQRLAEANSNHERDNPLRDEIRDTFDFLDPESPRGEFMTLLSVGLALPTFSEMQRTPSHQEQMKIAAELKALGATAKKRPDHNVWSVRLKKKQ
jgi:hypothetical protein